MPPAPTLDDGKYRVLVAEPLVRIPVHTPEWTDVQESDPGVTWLGLLAFLGEDALSRRRPDGTPSARVFMGRLIPGKDLAVIQRSPRMRESDYLAPGVYIEEVPFRSRTIEGVATSTAGLVGAASRCAAPRNTRRRIAIAIGAVTLAAIVGVMFWRLRSGGPGSTGVEHVRSDSAPNEALTGPPGRETSDPVP